MIDKVELIEWICGQDKTAPDLERVDAIRRGEHRAGQWRTKAGMLRKAKPRELDFVAKSILEYIRDARRRRHLDREALDFWERRLWAWHDEEQAQRGTVVELDEATRQALREALEHLGGGRLKTANDNFHTMRHFMLRAIRAVCTAIVHDRGDYRPEHDAARMFAENAVEVSVRLRRKTAEEETAEQIEHEAERLIAG